MEIALTGKLPSARRPSGVTVRRADYGTDAPAIYRLLEVAFAGTDEQDPPYDEWLAWWTSDLEWDPTAWFVAEAAGELAGVALCWRSGFLKDLAVHPEHRRRGIGRALLLHVFDEFRRRGVATISLKVDANNPTGAVRLYQSVGMDVVERL
jgi:ribosomal protein S18 acetylase RimI-like enzyme